MHHCTLKTLMVRLHAMATWLTVWQYSIRWISTSTTYCDDEEEDEAAAEAAHCEGTQHPLLETPPHNKLGHLPWRIGPQERGSSSPAQESEGPHNTIHTQHQPEVLIIVHSRLCTLALVGEGVRWAPLCPCQLVSPELPPLSVPPAPSQVCPFN